MIAVLRIYLCFFVCGEVWGLKREVSRIVLPPFLCDGTVLSLHVGEFHPVCPLPPKEAASVNLELTSFLNESNWSDTLSDFNECLVVLACVENATLAEWTTIENFLQRGRDVHLIIALPLENGDSEVMEDFKQRFGKSNATALLSKDSVIWQNYPHCRWEKAFPESPKWPQFDTCEPIVYQNHGGGIFPPLSGVTDANNNLISPCDQATLAVQQYGNVSLVQNLQPVGMFFEDYRKTPSNGFGQYMKGKVDIYSCHWAYLNVRNRYMAFHYGDDNTGVLLVKKAVQRPQTIESLVGSFCMWTYLSMLGTFLAVLLLLRVYQFLIRKDRKSFGDTVFHLSSMLLQQAPPNAFNGITERYVSFVWWIFAIIFATAYSSSLVSEMTIPALTKPVESVAEVEQAGLLYNAESRNEDFIHPLARIFEEKYSYFDVEKLKTTNRFRNHPSLDAALNASLVNDGVVIGDLVRVKYADNFDQFHVMEEKIHMMSGAYYRPHLFGIAKVLEIRRRLLYSGHRQRWLNLVFHSKAIKVRGRESVSDLNGSIVNLIPAFQVWGLGLSAAIVAFCAEYLLRKKRNFIHLK